MSNFKQIPEKIYKKLLAVLKRMRKEFQTLQPYTYNYKTHNQTLPTSSMPGEKRIVHKLIVKTLKIFFNYFEFKTIHLFGGKVKSNFCCCCCCYQG